MITPPAEIKEFGCTLCQTWHREGAPLYSPHLWAQSKHGIRTRLVRRDSHGRELTPVRRADDTVVWVG